MTLGRDLDVKVRSIIIVFRDLSNISNAFMYLLYHTNSRFLGDAEINAKDLYLIDILR